LQVFSTNRTGSVVANLDAQYSPWLEMEQVVNRDTARNLQSNRNQMRLLLVGDVNQVDLTPIKAFQNRPLNRLRVALAPSPPASQRIASERILHHSRQFVAGNHPRLQPVYQFMMRSAKPASAGQRPTAHD
jgi:hypothetical protein